MQSIVAVYDCHFKISSRIMDYKPDPRRNEVLIIISTLYTATVPTTSVLIACQIRRNPPQQNKLSNHIITSRTPHKYITPPD